MPDLPARFAALIITFAPLFVQRSSSHAQVLLVGANLAPGRRAVASVLRITGHARDKYFTNYHRVLSRAPWSARGGARIPLAHLVRAFAPRGPVVVGLDDTIERRWRPRISARGIYRDPVRSGSSAAGASRPPSARSGPTSASKRSVNGPTAPSPARPRASWACSPS